MTLCCLRVTDSDRSGSTLGGASSLSTDSVEGTSSSILLTLDEPLESWLDRLENRRENSLRVELRPSISGRLVASGVGRGGSEFSDLEVLYHLWEEEEGVGASGGAVVVGSGRVVGVDWKPENRAKVLPVRSRPAEERTDELEERGRLSRDEKEVDA